MRRIKKHKIKTEQPETSTSHSQAEEDYDLAYYIHDRVELMHQVFSVLRHKDVKAMAPECVRHISIDDLQELCTEELLGISSKRLCATLDGAAPPSDTESSASPSPARLETISLDSISSDEILSEGSGKKSKKHKHRHRKSKKPKPSSSPSQSRASRAGLTVLELLELQARARAIRAQLQKEQAAKKQSESVAESVNQSDQDDIEIKEEPAEVVEISSDEDKPKVEPAEKSTTSDPESPKDSQMVTKRKNNLIITVPQTKQTRKIKLNRTKATAADADKHTDGETSPNKNDKPKAVNEDKEIVQTEKAKTTAIVKSVITSKDETKAKKKIRKREKKKNVDKEGSDHDEITLQLSDTEKMDLLEDLDRKNFDKLSSSSSEDSESSSSDSDNESQGEEPADKPVVKETTVSQNKEEERLAEEAQVKESKITSQNEQETLKQTEVSANLKVVEDNTEKQTPTANSNVEITNKSDKCNKEIDGSNSSNTNEKSIENVSPNCTDKSREDITNDKGNICVTENKSTDMSIETVSSSENVVYDSSNGVVTSESGNVVTKIDVVEKEAEQFLVVTSVEDIPLAASEQLETINETTTGKEAIATPEKEVEKDWILMEKVIDLEQESKEKDTCQLPITITDNIIVKDVEKQSEPKELSDGELSERASSEVEAFEPQPEVVCISDEDTSKKSQKKKKKKEKKHKKEKKAKKSKSDFRESGDQNFYKEPDKGETAIQNIVDVNAVSVESNESIDDVYEILELSDDSSCYEVEGTVLSKEPTTEEIEALSAKIDQIEREDVVTEEEIREHEQMELEKTTNNDDNVEQISWKDRYLDSNKVKKVLSTSGIFNALRKKNRELKKKLEESKKKEEIEEVVTEDVVVEETSENVEEGSIEQFNALQGSNKYVDPVSELTEKVENEVTNDKELAKVDAISVEIPPATKEMKKDAKQLLKMYKRLLKYNDITKQKDPKKKKKKSRKKSNASVASTENVGV